MLQVVCLMWFPAEDFLVALLVFARRCTHSQLNGEKCQNFVVHPKFSPDVSYSHPPPPPPPEIGNLGFRQIWTQHQKLDKHPTPPPPPTPHQTGNLGFRQISIKSWKNTPYWT